ncbi:MAG: hypothetical protein ACREUU_13385, partial [Gammaproteobacteria bacterium]
HQYDHRWATYENGEKRDCTDDQKADPNFTVTPRYWVPEQEVIYRASRVPPPLIHALREGRKREAAECLTLWLASFLSASPALPYHLLDGGAGAHLRESAEALLREEMHDLPDWQRRWPLTEDDLRLFSRHEDALELAGALVEKRCPKWFIAFRDITNATNERTAIFSVIPRSGVGHTAPLVFLTKSESSDQALCFLANVNSLPFDYAVRQKIGGTHLTFTVFEQCPVLSPNHYRPEDRRFLAKGVTELVCTGGALKALSRDLDASDAPFEWKPETARKTAGAH